MRLVPVDLGGSTHSCHVAPPQRAIPGGDALRLIRREYAEKYPGEPLQVAFFHGGFPNSDLLTACAGDPIRLSLNPADLDRKRAKLLIDSGTTTVELEVMTFEPHVLRTCSRPYTSSQARAMGNGLKKMGLDVGVHLVPGLPSADVETALQDVEDVARSGWVDFVRIWPALGFTGATITDWALNGAWHPWDVDQTVNVVGQMIQILESRSVPVIRVGIQPGQDIPVRALVGPQHPNLRGEIESRRFGDRLMSALDGTKPGAEVVIRVNGKDLAWAKGTSNFNGRRCKSHFRLESLRFQVDPTVMRGAVRVEGGNDEPTD